MSVMSATNEKIPAVLYTERIYSIGGGGPPTARSLWIPSYGLIISFLGSVRKASERPYQTIEEQKEFIQKWKITNRSIIDPQICETEIDKEIVIKAKEIFYEKHRLEILTNKNNEKLGKLILFLEENMK